MNSCKLSVVVPCFNEQEAVPIFYNEVKKILVTLKAEYEIIFIDDGSSDKTLEEVKELSEKDKGVHYVSFSRNFGKEAAMYAGLKKAAGDYVVIMDVDLQDPPSLIPEMLSAVCSGEFDSAATRRTNRKGEPPVRSMFARLFYKLMRYFSDIDIVDGARDFRMMSRTMVDAVLSVSERGRFSKGIFAWVGFRTKYFEYKNVERSAGKTKWNFRKLFFVFARWNCCIFYKAASSCKYNRNFIFVPVIFIYNFYNCTQSFVWRSYCRLAIPCMHNSFC